MKIHFLITLLWAHHVASQCADGWESDMNVWMANGAKFTPPLCYQFTVTTNTISSSTAISRVVTVKNGDPLEGDMALTDYMDEIGSSCYMGCPESGASCRVTYYATGYPYQILIDENQSLVGEERNVEISNYAELACDEIEDIPVGAITNSPSDAASEVPSDTLSSIPSDVPTFVGQPADAPVASPVEPFVPVDEPVGSPVDIPVAPPVADTGDVSDINGIDVESSAPRLLLLPMAALTMLLQVFP